MSPHMLQSQAATTKLLFCVDICLAVLFVGTAVAFTSANAYNGMQECHRLSAVHPDVSCV